MLYPLDIDLKKLEHCFDWKGLYTAFFHEERERRRRMKASAELQRAPFEVIKRNGRRGAFDSFQAVGSMVSL